MLKIVRRAFSFLDWAKSHPRDPPPGDWLDIEFDQLIDAFDEWDQRVRQAITPDGKVAPGTVTADSLDPAFFRDLAQKITKIGDELLENARNEAKRAESAARMALLAQTQASDASIRAISVENAILPLKTDIFAAIAAAAAPKAAPRTDTPDPESFQGHSEAWADASRAWAEHMPDTIPGLVLAEMDITGDHWSSRWWANRADNAFGRLTDLYLGAWPDPPTQNLEGGPITVGSIYYNTDTGQMYVWDGDSWNSMTQPARAGIASLWYAAADGQTVFPFSVADLNGHNYALSIDATEGVDAHVNGVKVMPQELTEGDWTLNAAASTVTFLRPLRAGDIVSFDILMANEKLGPGAVNSWSLALGEAKDGTRTTFTLTMETLGGPAVTVVKNEELIVSLDGVIQEPGVSYNASGNSISFAQAPAADSWVFITWFRSEGGAGTLSTGGGNTFRLGTGAPADGLGAVGDVYLDTVTGRLYGPKVEVGALAPDTIAFRSQSTLPFTLRPDTIVPKPAGTAADDILVAVVLLVRAPAPTTPVPPAGWTQLGTWVATTGGGSNIKFGIFWKRATASEPADYTWAHFEACNSQAVIQAWTGCLETGDPVDAFSQNSAVSGSTATATGITTTQANDMLLYLAHNWDGTGTLNPPAGMAEHFDVIAYAASQALVTAGATGNRTQTLSSSNPWAAFLVALKPGFIESPVWPQSADLATQAELDAAP